MMNRIRAAELAPRSFRWSVNDNVATITLSRPERRNPLTFESYVELGDTFHQLRRADDVRVVVITGEGENFSSGGDVHDIIGPLIEMRQRRAIDELLAFTRLTGELVRAMRACPQPILAAIDGACVGAGAILAMASDMRFGTARSKVAFLFTRVGLSGADMGACAILPRLIGQGRASELLYSGRAMSGEEAERWGFYNRILPPESLLAETQAFARELAGGPAFAHAMTKRSLHQEWAMGIDEAIEAEAQAQAICTATEDFERAYHAFIAKEKPRFEGR